MNVISDGKDSLFAVATDRHGSLVATQHTASGAVERYSYKPFGGRRNPDNWVLNQTAAVRFSRGYCMHEHVPEVGLIDMGGRMYDPTLCQFVSPDPYIQDPTCWQNFNRYGYCLQNPMLYTDPDGEIVWVPVIIGAVVGGVVNWGIHGFEFNSSGLAAFGIGAAAGAVGAATFGVGAASIGATFGVSSVPTAFMAGTISSFTSGMLLGTGNTILLGDPMISPQSLIFSSLLGGTFCGLAQGLSNWIAGNKLWTGKPTWEDVPVNGTPIDESMVEPLQLKNKSDLPSSTNIGVENQKELIPKPYSESAYTVTPDGIILPKDCEIPRNLIQNEHRLNSYGGTDINGKYQEIIRIDKGTPPGYKGPNESHFHLNNGSKHIFDINKWPYKR